MGDVPFGCDEALALRNSTSFRKISVESKSKCLVCRRLFLDQRREGLYCSTVQCKRGDVTSQTTRFIMEESEQEIQGHKVSLSSRCGLGQQ